MQSFKMIEMEIIRWGEARGIIQNSTALKQFEKTLEEIAELGEALKSNDKAQIIDGVGDTLVTLTMICAILDIDLTQCYNAAYEEIKDRKGFLNQDGIFVKDV